MKEQKQVLSEKTASLIVKLLKAVSVVLSVVLLVGSVSFIVGSDSAETYEQMASGASKCRIGAILLFIATLAVLAVKILGGQKFIPSAVFSVISLVGLVCGIKVGYYSDIKNIYDDVVMGGFATHSEHAAPAMVGSVLLFAIGLAMAIISLVGIFKKSKKKTLPEQAQ